MINTMYMRYSMNDHESLYNVVFILSLQMSETSPGDERDGRSMSTVSGASDAKGMPK